MFAMRQAGAHGANSEDIHTFPMASLVNFSNCGGYFVAFRGIHGPVKKHDHSPKQKESP